jgi:hypothetical protein
MDGKDEYGDAGGALFSYAGKEASPLCSYQK